MAHTMKLSRKRREPTLNRAMRSASRTNYMRFTPRHRIIAETGDGDVAVGLTIAE